MSKKAIVLFSIIMAAFVLGFIFHSGTRLSDNDIRAVFTPVNDNNIIDSATGQASTSYDNSVFISFSGPHLLDISGMLQMPDYPTGCEIVSLTMALSYITISDVDTGMLIDDYLNTYSKDFTSGFMGDPRSADGGGCFPPVIEDCANKYLSEQHIPVVAKDSTGIELSAIFDNINNGFPVLMWTTMYMGKPAIQSLSAVHNDTEYHWYIDEHCVLVKGYNLSRNVFIINDPLVGEVERDIDDFMDISDAIGRLSVTFSFQ